MVWYFMNIPFVDGNTGKQWPFVVWERLLDRRPAGVEEAAGCRRREDGMRREEEEDGTGLEGPGPADGWRPLSKREDTGTTVEDTDTAAQNGLAQWKEGDDRRDTFFFKGQQ